MSIKDLMEKEEFKGYAAKEITLAAHYIKDKTEKRVIETIYGIDSDELTEKKPKDYEAAADELGKTVAEVELIEQQALESLKDILSAMFTWTDPPEIFRRGNSDFFKTAETEEKE